MTYNYIIDRILNEMDRIILLVPSSFLPLLLLYYHLASHMVLYKSISLYPSISVPNWLRPSSLWLFWLFLDLFCHWTHSLSFLIGSTDISQHDILLTLLWIYYLLRNNHLQLELSMNSESQYQQIIQLSLLLNIEP